MWQEPGLPALWFFLKLIPLRKLDHKTLEALRVRAVQRVMDGESPEVVIKALGMSRARIYEWLAAYREGGFEALKAKQISGRPKKLSGEQIRELYTWITTFTPDQLKFNFALWTRGRVRELIRQKFNVRLSDVSVGRLLRNLGLTPQKPLHRAYQQKPEAVKQWKEETYQRFAKKPRKLALRSTLAMRPAFAPITTVALPGRPLERRQLFAIPEAVSALT